MAQAVGKYAANKFLKKQMKGYKNKTVDSGNDPYFAMVEDPKRPGKYKKKKKQIPAYIPEHDAMVLASVRKSAYRLDMCLFSFLGIRFGWEAAIGLIPLAGDAIGVALALLVVRKAMQVEGGLPSTIKLRMLINILIDFCVGLVPFIGDLADAAFKCNTMNLRLLEEVLDKKYKPKELMRDERDLVGVDREKRRQSRRSGIFPAQDPPPATAFEENSDSEDDVRPAANATRVQQPRPTRAPEDRRGGWFSSPKIGSRRDRQQAQPVQQEMGTVRV